MSPLFDLRPESVAFVGGGDKAAILREMAEIFARAWGLDRDRVLEHLEERERLGSAGFGRGVAIPHARFPDLARPVAALLRLDHPAEYQAADAMPVELVFGLLTPENSGAAHLHALAAISRLVRDDRMREALVDAPDEEALFSLVTNAADLHAA